MDKDLELEASSLPIEEQVGKIMETLRFSPIVLGEDCDCGSQIRHNNGGNYHSFLKIKRVGSKLFFRYGDSGEGDLYPPTDYEPCGWETARSLVRDAIREGWE